MEPPPVLAAAIQAAVTQARAQGIRQLAARVDACDTALIHALEGSGFRLVDTLAIFELRLGQDGILREVSLPEGVAIRLAAAADVPVLMDMARRTFSDRALWRDRFHADPHIPDALADELYAQWVKNSIAPDAPGDSMADVAWVAVVEGRLAGFLTGRLDRSQGTLVGAVSLNAVDAPYRGRGIYRALVRGSMPWFWQKGCALIRVRTSLASHGVRRTWTQLGAFPVSNEHTFHWWER